MKFFSYVVARDYGFAPNPFNGICTLATCKPDIRKIAEVGDWVFGTGSTPLKCTKHLIYAMKITEKTSFNEYWTNPKYNCKKPVMNGSLKTMYGDNIYHHDGKQWVQADSHHSLDDGSVNLNNLNRDTKVNAVLISDYFFYFGGQFIEMPAKLVDKICKVGPGFRYADNKASEVLIQFMESKYRPGYFDDPIQFKSFERYRGN